MTEEIKSRIKNELTRIEMAEKVTVLYACESGSRAWGFESADSDYDVRFIYLRRTEWYLTIQEKRDVIERPLDDELDISGWDLRKAFQLLCKSNPPLLEWLNSPTVYADTANFRARMRKPMNVYYSPTACMYHYLHMAEKNFRQYLKDDEVRTKKYFYALRPVLACIWIERGYGVVPVEFSELMARVADDLAVKREINALLEQKRAGLELHRGPRNPILSDFLEREIARLQAKVPPQGTKPNIYPLDRDFLDIIKEVNGQIIEFADSETI